MLLKPKRVLENEFNLDWGVCLWQLPDGTYVMEGDNHLVVGPCKIGNPIAERNMRSAARSLGITEGKPFWLPGFRVISDSEHDDQMERLIDGKIPDAADLYRQLGENV